MPTYIINKMSKTQFFTKRGLRIFYDIRNMYEIGIDEVGRGPLFGRVYAAAVVLPKNMEYFNHEDIRDSKKIKSTKNINKIANYIKDNAIAYSVCYEDEKIIDKINIRQSVFRAMHNAIYQTFEQLGLNAKLNTTDIKLLVDGNDFKPYTFFNKNKNIIDELNHITIEGGDDKFTSIAAASILAKQERDKYIESLCEEHPFLQEHYAIGNNKGYGTKRHMDGIKKYGITDWHRKTYGICKNY